jgi:RNA polymerase sigma-70 factor (ECF subfamily)
MDLSAFLDTHGPALRLYARQWSRDAHSAEDAVQDGLVSCWRVDPVLGSLPTIYVAVRNAAINLTRGQRRREWREHATVNRNEYWFDCPLSARERDVAIQAALTHLPIEQRECVILHLWGMQTFAQVGAIQDCSANTAASRYRYAIQALKLHLAEEAIVL